MSLFPDYDVVNPAISADQYQLQHAHSNILKKPLDEVLRLKDPPEALELKAYKCYYHGICPTSRIKQCFECANWYYHHLRTIRPDREYKH